MNSCKKIFEANRAWVSEKLQVDQNYFSQLSKDPSPEYLWIGCSDARVPAEDITGTQPGELFVHRNIANLVLHTDFNTQAVLQYAIDVLKVKHVIVCGHYGCGGVRAAMTNQNFGLMNQWLRNIKDLFQRHREEIVSCGDEEAQLNRLVELSVLEQVSNIRKSHLLQNAWKQDRMPTLHGWVFNMKDGLLKSLYQFDPGSPIEAIYRYELK